MLVTDVTAIYAAYVAKFDGNPGAAVVKVAEKYDIFFSELFNYNRHLATNNQLKRHKYKYFHF